MECLDGKGVLSDHGDAVKYTLKGVGGEGEGGGRWDKSGGTAWSHHNPNVEPTTDSNHNPTGALRGPIMMTTYELTCRMLV